MKTPRAIDILKRLRQTGELETLRNAGLVSRRATVHLKAHDLVEQKIKAGTPRTQAIEEVGEELGLSDRTMFRLEQKFRK